MADPEKTGAPPAYSVQQPAGGYPQPPPVYPYTEYPAQQGHTTGYTAQQGHTTGYPAQQGHTTGYPAQQGHTAGYTVQHGSSTIVTTQPVGYVQASPPPRDYFTASILATICCFWPTGIFAIMRASETRSAIARGDMAAAQQYSRSARTMYHVTIGVGVAMYIILCIFIGVYIGVFVNLYRRR